MASDEALTLLRSIDATLKELLALSRRRTSGATTPAGPVVASDRDLDGKYGDPVIKAKDPRDWPGPSMKGRRFSQCDPVYLDLLADRCDYFARQADEKGEMTDKGKPKSQYYRLDAARAAGWAARIRAGKHKATPTDEAKASEVEPQWAGDDSAWAEEQ